MTRARLAVLLSVLVALSVAVTACGGDSGGSGDQASASTDVNELLTKTFTAGNKKIDSGKLDVALKLDASGGSSQLNGPVSVRLTGPFESQGTGKLPKFKLDVAFEGAGQSVKAGATSTGEKAYVNFQGTDYVADNATFNQFKAGYEQAQKQNGNKPQSFASLGMDPRKWLTNPTNAGEAKVGDADTIKITGGVDLAKLLDDVNAALEKAGSLGLAGSGQVPSKLTEAQKQEVVRSVKDPRVEIYTGKDDQIMRRMVVNLGVDDAKSSTKATVGLDISLTDLNQGQDIPEPSNAKPLQQLLGQLGGLGALSGGGASGSGSGSGSASGGGSSSQNLEKYSKCVTDAGNDVAKARKCADLLTG